ncbi:hypothetical protein [Brevundimonas nasdae]|uniref:hypothetical protein n=1 Tax=Brevundimonas nasdae TaxID=172043 RepID=UPI003F691F60
MITLMLALLADPSPALAPVGVGRFAIYADVNSIARDGDIARMRELQVTETGFKVGDVLYVGGWSRWAFDCRAMTADRLDFSSLRADGTEGPATPDNAPAYPAASGGDAAELLAVACASQKPTDTMSLGDAVRLGQQALAE